MCMNAHIDTLENWNEIRTAYHVARLGTLSAAAEFLGVHHATVIRHIDALEAQLQSKLFHRHPRGYMPTEAGQDLMQTVAATEDQFSQLAGRLRGKSATVSGELVVTTLSGLSSQFTPLLIEFQRLYPEVRISLVAEERRLKLEYGEAHVALRAGQKPQEPDNVVQLLSHLPMSLFAHKSYVDRYGLLRDDNDAENHLFVVNDDRTSRAPYSKWIQKNVEQDSVVFRATQMRSLTDAVHAGAGIGFLTLWAGENNEDLVQMMPSRPEWNTTVWMVTHVDLHRSSKVQAFLKFLKEKFTDV